MEESPRNKLKNKSGEKGMYTSEPKKRRKKVNLLYFFKKQTKKKILVMQFKLDFNPFSCSFV